MPKIAWFSPVTQAEPLRSAEFTRAIFRVFSERQLLAAGEKWEVDLFVDDPCLVELRENADEGPDAVPELYGVQAFHYLTAALRDAEKQYDYFVYQLEDHPRCAFVQSSLRIWPGVVYFHDVNLGRLDRSQLNHSDNGALLNDAMDELFGEDSVRLGDWRARGWSVEVLDRAYPHGEREMRQSAVIVVQNIRAMQEVKAKGMKTPVELSTFPLRLPTIEQKNVLRDQLRNDLGLSAQTPLIGYAGLFPLEERARLTLEAFSLLKSEQTEPVGSAKLLWIAQSQSAMELAEKLIDSVRGEIPDAVLSDIILVNAESTCGYEKFVAALDIMVGLRFDALRSVSFLTLLALAYGVPSILSDFGPSGEIPDAVALSLQVGTGEREALARSLSELIQNQPLRESLSVSAREFVETVCNPDAVLLDLETIFEIHQAHLTKLLNEARSDVQRAEGRLMKRTLNALNLDVTRYFPQDEVLPSGIVSLQTQLLQRFQKAFLDFGLISGE